MKLTEALEIISKQNADIESKYLQKVEKSVLAPPPDKAFESLALLRKKAVLEAKNEIHAVNASIDKGAIYILEYLKKHSPDQFEQLTAWFMQNTDIMINSFASEATSDEEESLAHKINFPPELLNLMYTTACKLFDLKDYDKAAAAITVCIAFEPLIYDLWFAYGSFLQAKHDDVGALYAFQMAQILDDENPSVYAYMAISWLALSKPDEARQSIRTALDHCKDKEGYEDFKDYCYGLHAYCDKQKCA